MRRIVLKFGLIAGAIMAVTFLIAFPFHDRIGWDMGLVVGYSSMVVAFLSVYFGIRTYRDEVAGGSVSFWGAVKVGLLIVLVATACYVATWEVYFYTVAPDFMEKWSEHVLAKARNDGATEAELAAKAAELAAFNESYKNPLVNIAYTALEPLPVGLLFTFVSAGLLSRRRRLATAPA